HTVSTSADRPLQRIVRPYSIALLEVERGTNRAANAPLQSPAHWPPENTPTLAEFPHMTKQLQPGQKQADNQPASACGGGNMPRISTRSPTISSAPSSL